jgi:hypothetical protein
VKFFAATQSSRLRGDRSGLAGRSGAARGRYRVSCTTRMPCRSVMRALGQRATAAR